jgi:hypothetical protein
MHPLKGIVSLLLVSLAIVTVFLPAAVFIHEAAHLLMYHLEGIPVTSIHVLDSASFEHGYLGFVTTTKQSAYGTTVYEGIANLAGYLFIAALLLLFLLGPLKTFTVHQLELIGLKRNTAPHLIES